MKKSTLALLTLSVVSSAAVQAAEVYNKDGNKLDLYGRVRAQHYISDNAKQDGDQTYVRLGFKGETQISDQLTGFGRWEYQVAGNKVEGDPTTSKTRLAFAGLKIADFGSIDYGRNYGVLYDVAAWTDMFPEFGADSYQKADNYMSGRASGIATYRNTDFFGLIDGLDVALEYQGKNEGDGRDPTKQNGDGYGTSLTYDFGGSNFSVGGAYTKSDRTSAQQALDPVTGKQSLVGRGDSAESWNGGVKYDDKTVYLAAMYGQSSNMYPISGNPLKITGAANKTQYFEAVAQYQFDFGLRPSLGYVQTKGKDIEGVGDVDLVKYIDVATYYYFNKNMNAYVEYKINQLDNDNKLKLNTDNVVALGMTYQF